jgi:hypothetical protein
MTKENCKHLEQCPFWSSSSTKCSLCNGGLFIPLDDHVEAFCKTFRYPSCVQYSLHSENQIYLQEKIRISENNRRKYLRLESSHKITLLKILQADKSESHVGSDAKTIDLSKGGIRMFTKDPLTNDALVQFSFDESFPQTFHEITGQVKWCNKQINETGYQAGISFQGAHIAEAMGRYLGQKYNQMQ